MLQREVSDSTWKETKKKKKGQPLYQQTVAIDWWHSSTGNVLPQKNKNKKIARCRWKRQRTFAKL